MNSWSMKIKLKIQDKKLYPPKKENDNTLLGSVVDSVYITIIQTMNASLPKIRAE